MLTIRTARVKIVRIKGMTMASFGSIGQWTIG